MKRGIFLLAAFLVAYALGWFLMDKVTSSSSTSGLMNNANEERISLLGSKGDVSKELPADLRQFNDVENVISQIDSASVNQLKQWLISLPEGSDVIAKIIIKKLAAIDPEETVDFLSRNADLARYVSIALVDWARTDLDSAAEAALRIDPNGSDMVRMMAELNAEPLQKLYFHLAEKGLQGRFAEHLITYLTPHDPQAAARLVLELAGEPGWQSGVSHLAYGWFAKDSDSLLAWAKEINDPKIRQEILIRIGHATIGSQGAEGLDQVWDLLSDTERERMVSSLYQAGGDLDELLDWMDENVKSPELYGQLISKMVIGLAESDDPEALARILSEVDAGFPLQEVELAIGRWAEKDMQGLQTWMNSLDDTNPELIATIHKGLLEHLVTDSPDRLLAFWEANPEIVPNETNGYLLYSMLLHHYRDPTGEFSIDALLARVPEQIRGSLAYTYAGGLSQLDPQEGIAYLESLPESEIRDNVLTGTVYTMAEKFPFEAAKWISEYQEGSVKTSLSVRLMTSWVQLDPDAAQEWFLAQAPTEQYNDSLWGLIVSQSRYDPARALALTLKLDKDAAQYYDRMPSLLGSIARSDPDTAADFIANELPPTLIPHDASKIIEDAKFLNDLLRESK